MDQITTNEPRSKSADLVSENIARLGQLFPEVLKEGHIDMDVLRDLIGDYADTPDERFCLNWAGKAQARREAQKQSTGTLRPCHEESVDWETTQNVYIEGDNLEVLKLLQKSYHGRVKMIYIDPPYNTGKDFVYKDDYNDNIQNYLELTGQDRSLRTNTESDGRYHSNWLNMMYPRLKLARNLLAEDGVIFISIDDNEVAQLRKLCDEVFGEDNFRNILAVRRYDKNLNIQFVDKGLRTFNVGFEYILCYSRSHDFYFNPIYKESDTERQTIGYWKGLWNSADRPTMRYDILGVTPLSGQWKWSKERAQVAVENYKIFQAEFSSKMTLEEYWISTGQNMEFIRRNNNGAGQNQGVENWIAPSEGKLRNTNWTDLFASKNEAIINGLFDFPKNVEVIKNLIIGSINEKSLILDFFSGSATTAHAVMQLNAEDGGNRRYIMVQLPEPCPEDNPYKNICEIGKERIRRAAAKIRQAQRAKQTDLFAEEHPLDTGFRVFKLDSSNINAWDDTPEHLEASLEHSLFNIKQGRSEVDLLYEILIKYGLSLTESVNVHRIAGITVYEIGAGALIACLADTHADSPSSTTSAITTEVAEGIGKLWEQVRPEGESMECRVVFRDAGFVNDTDKANVILTLKQHGILNVASI
ncbi:MAG: site-specific DNA-methyltransferase [Prevotellaceae bacterium]|jgi:adenine-specific DNA-methyltransferase|nr:site-specific DNA-methyltransferase [Prevotellaceae bacterium]